jgi:hypothetical protein
MSFPELLESQYFTHAVFGLGGAFLSWLTQQVLNKRGTFSYNVNHNRICITTDDAIFGSVGVTLNGNTIPNLYLSTINLVNESLNDYEKVMVHVYTNDTKLLTEQTQISGTPKILELSDSYKAKIAVSKGEKPTPEQFSIYSGQREYIVPVMNRGQTVKITYLNSATTNDMPNIWLDVSQKGVKLKFRPPQQTFMGIPQPRAALVGVIIGFILIWMLVSNSVQLWLAVTISFIYGLIAQLPGALIIRYWRKLREIIGG